MGRPRLSIIIPVYNEKDTIHELLDHVHAVPVDKEVLVVDDGSTDSSRQIILRDLKKLKEFHLIAHNKNRGKGNAVRAGIQAAAGEMIIIQDADLEYDPGDYLRLIEAMDSSGANIVYGSRFLGKKRVTSSWHRAVNWFLTAVTNVLYGSQLTDMETCYKLFRSSTLKALPLGSDGFEIEVELSARTLLSGERIVEVPVSYKGRSYHEGKKIGWKDGVKALALLVHYRFIG